MSARKRTFDIIRFILLLISVIGIWYLIGDWRRKNTFKAPVQANLPFHDNIRGKDHYQ